MGADEGFSLQIGCWNSEERVLSAAVLEDVVGNGVVQDGNRTGWRTEETHAGEEGK